ncbi:adenylate/guanylate cyclase family protein [Mycobacterium sp. BK558]|nr:adenylate/guanylate cyclase family protein [Mycobacterium sp. BK558]
MTGANSSIDELLDQAVAAINRGDRVAATAFADTVLAVDHGNAEAEDLLTAPEGGEIRRLTLLYVDLVDSAALADHGGLDTYGDLIRCYHEVVVGTVRRFDGYVDCPTGETILAIFGHPVAHEDDVRRAVLAALEITAGIDRLGRSFEHHFGRPIAARAGVHRGLVFLDTAQNDVYGLGANLAARVAGLAAPGRVVVSASIARLIGTVFELAACEPAAVKGVAELVAHHRVLGERVTQAVRIPLVGRGRELAQLRGLWTQAQSGALATPGVVVRGEAGIGKSSLAAAAAGLARDSGAVVLTLGGSAMHADTGLHPIRQLLESRCNITRVTSPSDCLRLLVAELISLGRDPAYEVPLLAPVLSIGPEHGYEPVAAEGERLYHLVGEAVQSYLRACLGPDPALVLVEDGHVLDRSTIEVIGSLLAAADGRLLVVVTGRPGAWLPADWPVTVLELHPLTRDEADTLITVLAPDVSADVRAAVAERCDGIPFYIEQVAGGLTQTGVPEGLYEPLLARLRASAGVVPVVEAAALIGRRLDADVLRCVVDLSGDVLDGILDELADARVLEPAGPSAWRFRHELLRELAMELAPPTVRRTLHAKIAAALVGGGEGEAELDWRLVATHFEEAENHGEAVSAYQRASVGARRRGALAEARRDLSRALAQVNAQPPGRDRDKRELTVRLERGFLASAAEGPMNPSTSQDFEECLRLGSADVHDDEVIGTLLALGGYHFAVGDLFRSTAVLRALRAGMSDERAYFRPVVDACLGVEGWMNGAFVVAREQMEEATAAFAAEGRHSLESLWFAPTDPIVMAHGVLGLDRIAGGDLDAAEAQLTLAVRRAGQLSFPQGPFSWAFTRFFETWIRIEAGQLARAAALADGLIEHADRYGFEVWALWGAAQRAVVDAVDAVGGDADVLSERIDRATGVVETVRRAGLNVFITLFDGVLAKVLIAGGRAEEARVHLDRALALGRDIGMCFYEGELHRLRAHTHSDPDDVRADLAVALDTARGQCAHLYELRATLDDFALRGESARGALVAVNDQFALDNPLPERSRCLAVLAAATPEAQ